MKVVVPNASEGSLLHIGEVKLVVGKDGYVTGTDDEVRLVADALGIQPEGEPAPVVEEAPPPPPAPKVEKTNGPKE